MLIVMNKATLAKRERAVSAALGSVRAEGLKPSAKTQKLLHRFARGEITADDALASTLKDIQRKPKNTK